MKDTFGREITYARISLTDLCNYRCFYCMGDNGVLKKSHADMLSVEQMLKITEALRSLGIVKIRLTGGEPLVKKGFDNFLRGISKQGFECVSVTTNGYYLAEKLSVMSENGINRVNVSIDSLNPDKYKSITRGGDIERVTDGIKKAVLQSFSVKTNGVLLNGINDGEVEDFAEWGKINGVLPRFIELMPFRCQTEWANKHYVSANEIIKKYGAEESKFYDGGNCRYYTINGNLIGFISPISNHFCGSCNRIRITADGKLLNCLHENKEYDLRPFLGDLGSLKSHIEEFVLYKPAMHNIINGEYQNRAMTKIGG